MVYLILILRTSRSYVSFQNWFKIWFQGKLTFVLHKYYTCTDMCSNHEYLYKYYTCTDMCSSHEYLYKYYTCTDMCSSHEYLYRYYTCTDVCSSHEYLYKYYNQVITMQPCFLSEFWHKFKHYKHPDICTTTINNPVLRKKNVHINLFRIYTRERKQTVTCICLVIGGTSNYFICCSQWDDCLITCTYMFISICKFER